VKKEEESVVGVIIKDPESAARAVFPLSLDRPLTIGRVPDNVIYLTDPRVARHQCLVYVEDGRVYLKAAFNSNTWVNNERVQERRQLESGDEIIVGTTMFRFEQAEVEQAEARDEVNDDV
jgi:pSer/pThr/pTyr-binding forkhead associated (FHA) protein